MVTREQPPKPPPIPHLTAPELKPGRVAWHNGDRYTVWDVGPDAGTYWLVRDGRALREPVQGKECYSTASAKRLGWVS